MPTYVPPTTHAQPSPRLLPLPRRRRPRPPSPPPTCHQPLPSTCPRRRPFPTVTHPHPRRTCHAQHAHHRPRRHAPLSGARCPRTCCPAPPSGFFLGESTLDRSHCVISTAHTVSSCRTQAVLQLQPPRSPTSPAPQPLFDLGMWVVPLWQGTHKASCISHVQAIYNIHD